jgi:VanZ family protein
MTAQETKHVTKAWLPVLLWMGFIFVMSTDAGSSTHTSSVLEPVVQWIDPTISAEQFDFVHFLVRKSAHFTEYAVLALLMLRALRSSLLSNVGRWSLRAAGVTLLASAAYATTDEFHQSFVMGRTASLHDIMVDSCGALVAIVVAGLMARDFKREPKQKSYTA